MYLHVVICSYNLYEHDIRSYSYKSSYRVSYLSDSHDFICMVLIWLCTTTVNTC